MNSNDLQSSIVNRQSSIANWKVVAASVAGVSHEKAGLPCQDAHAVRPLPPDALVIAVADGAGSAALADVGAQIAAQTAVEVCARLAGLRRGTGAEVQAEDLRVVLQETRAALEAEAETRGEPVREFATTLIVAYASTTQVAVLQVGDGAAVVQYGEERTIALTTPPEGEYANSTVFLTSPDALAAAQIVVEPLVVSALAVFSDGLQRLALKLPEGTPHAPFFAPLFRFAAQTQEPTQAEQQLHSFLRSPRITDRADDDLTLALAVKEER